MEYIEETKPQSGCIFCSAVADSDDLANLVIFRGERVFIILNRYPYTSGHLMAVPYEHQPSLEAIQPETRAEMMELTSQAIQVLRQAYTPQGFNIGINIGHVAGAGIADHVHMHVVPRWGGDTNFMSSLADTRVLPESLEDTYRRVKEAWDIQHPSGAG